MFKVEELLEATGGKLISYRDKADIRGISIDSRTIRPYQVFLAIKGDNFNGHDFIAQAVKKGASCVILEAPLSVRKIKGNKKAVFIEVKDTLKALGDIARLRRRKFDIPLIAVTGTNGKTTTKEMLSRILSVRHKVLSNEGTKNNQIGVPMTLLKLDSSHDIAVIELGTNQFGEIEYLSRICLPNVGIITNIGPGHLQYLHNLRGVFREKYAMPRNLKAPAIAILNNDDKILAREVARKSARPLVFGFGILCRSDFSASGIKDAGAGIEFRVNKKYKFTLPSLGYYNIYNALAAIATARIFGLTYGDISRELSGFDFPEGRLKAIKIKGVNFLDDTYNSNPLSLEEALGTLRNFQVKGRRIFVMGDMLELGRGEGRYHYLAGKKAGGFCDAFIAVGRLSRIAAGAALDASLDKKNIFICKSSEEARQVLFEKLIVDKDDIILVKGSRLMKMERVLQ